MYDSPIEEIHIYGTDSKQIVAEDMNIAVLMNNTSGTIQDHLRVNECVIDSYQQARSVILNYIRSNQQFGPTPMDIGRIGKGGKGNKGQYKSSGESNANYNSDENYTEHTSSY